MKIPRKLVDTSNMYRACWPRGRGTRWRWGAPPCRWPGPRGRPSRCTPRTRPRRTPASCRTVWSSAAGVKYFPQNLDYILIPQFISQISEESLARIRAGLHDPPPVDEEDKGGGCGGGGGGWLLHGHGVLRGVVTLALDTDGTSQAAGAQTNKESKQDVESWSWW